MENMLHTFFRLDFAAAFRDFSYKVLRSSISLVDFHILISETIFDEFAFHRKYLDTLLVVLLISISPTRFWKFLQLCENQRESWL